MSTKCLQCGKPISYGEMYCPECVEYLSATNKLPYSLLWKCKLSEGGCIGCKYISYSGTKCEECIRSHTPAPPYIDRYERS